MYVCIILIVFICETLAYEETIEQSPNVGSILFHPAHLKKKYWRNNEIALLEARKHFQNLINSLKFIDPLNDNYVDTLLDYFRNAYMFIKKEAYDAESDSIMTTALSDALGGYIKLWALPVTKYNFYGGTVSTENAMKLYLFYNQLKNYLGTDGKEWRNPDEAVLHSLTINVARPPRRAYARSMDDPCDHLFLYEKTSNGLTAPIPYINWDDKYGTMFLPLKNLSFVALSSPKSAEMLFKYYDLAKECMRSISPNDQNIFDERFQNWLTNDVVPHLSDENLYIAFGSVLSLINRTRDLCDKVLDTCESKLKNGQPFFSNVFVNVLSKKFLFIMLLIGLEAAWCIPAIIYILCLKKKGDKKHLPPSNLYLFVDPGKQKKNKHSDGAPEGHKKKRKRTLHDAEVGRTHINQEFTLFEKSNTNQGSAPLQKSNIDQEIAVMDKPNIEQKITFREKSKAERLEVASCASTYSIGTRSKSYFDSNVCSAELLRIFSKPPVTSIKPILNNTSKPDNIAVPNSDYKSKSHCDISLRNLQPTNEICELTPEPDNERLRRNFIKQSNITPAVDLFTENEKIVKRALMHSTSFLMETLSEYRQSEIVTEKTTVNIKKAGTDERTIECHCTFSPQDVSQIAQTECITENEEDELIMLTDKETETSKHKFTRFKLQEPPKKMEMTGVKLNSGTPYLEIGLVRPEKSKFLEMQTDKAVKNTPIPTLTPKCNKYGKPKRILPIKSLDISNDKSAKNKNDIPKPIHSEIKKRESPKIEIPKKDSNKPETSKTESSKGGLKIGPWQIKSAKLGSKYEPKPKKNEAKNTVDEQKRIMTEMTKKFMKDPKVVNKIELARYRKTLENLEDENKKESPRYGTSTPRPSRIPKRSSQICPPTINQQPATSSGKNSTCKSTYKSYIPTLTKRAVDDCVIRKAEASKTNDKLNITV